MKNVKTCKLLALSVMICAGAVAFGQQTPSVLVYSRTEGFHHNSIPAGNAAIIRLGQQAGFTVDTTTDGNFFREDALKKYAAVVFLNTTGNVLNSEQELAFERYIQAGGGFVGVHAATDTEYDWGWYGRLVGGYFQSHPRVQHATLRVADAAHPSTAPLPLEWKRKDEWYNFKKLNTDVKLLLTIDEKSYDGGKLGDTHPMAWYHAYDGGRAFYTGLGHTEESYTDSLFLKHLLGGIQYAVGENKGLDYAKAQSQPAPEEDRFVKTSLTEGTLFEPTEMAVLPNLDILIAQRRGEILLLNGKTNTVKRAGFLKVYHKATVSGVNAEEGLLGLAVDPDFLRNNYVYVFYSPADTSVNRLSRFVLRNNKLEPKSEKVVLQFYSQRNICCHTGGSIAFGADNLLYLSTGDNATPFNERGQAFVNSGFAPLNDATGHEQYDARRSAGNTADLRGKILRIRIKPDGGYEIPDGNLFPATPKARPEIYVMGNRNPYRISVDKKTGYLYWGEVGPDANNDSLSTRGPRGYDEVNQARRAGFFGWPLFVGDNYPYHEYNYTTGKPGPSFDPASPVNDSRNNTGLKELPPAQPAFIWYPYAASPHFPQVGTGGRNAMAGPVYDAAGYNHVNKLPDYYNGKLFIYDWVRGWVKAVTMRPNGDFDKMEPFMQGTKFNSPIDMEMGPDGRLYVLEYGTGWFSKNRDAGVARLDFMAGNRPPKIKDFAVTKTSGLLPFTLVAKADAFDPDKSSVKYTWRIGTQALETTEPLLTHTFTKAGSYPLSVTVSDEQNNRTTSKTVTVYAGNEEPEVTINVKPNRTFYFPGRPVQYAVAVKDKGAKVNLQRLVVSTENAVGFDKAESPQGHAAPPQGHADPGAAASGKGIMLTLDCMVCHKQTEKSVGPSYVQVANRYVSKNNAVPSLAQKIIKGSVGSWGEVPMPAHPNLKPSDAAKIVSYILSLETKPVAKKGPPTLPATGRLLAPASRKPLIINAAYTDNGAAGVKALKTTATVQLRNNVITADEIRDIRGFTKRDSADLDYFNFPGREGWIRLPQVDLGGIRQIEIRGLRMHDFESDEWAVALDSAAGEIISKELKPLAGGVGIALNSSQEGTLRDVYLLYRGRTARRNAAFVRELRFLP